MIQDLRATVSLLLLAPAAACGGKEPPASRGQPPAPPALAAAERRDLPPAPSPADSVVEALSDSVLSQGSFAGIRPCAPLDSVRHYLPHARDSVVQSETESWPARRAPLGPGRWVLVESSWADTTHAWRVSTNSPIIRTRSGVHVGSTLRDVLATGDSLGWEYDEGALVLKLINDGAAFLLDDSSVARFYRRDVDERVNPVGAIDRAATVKELIAAWRCG